MNKLEKKPRDMNNWNTKKGEENFKWNSMHQYEKKYKTYTGKS